MWHYQSTFPTFSLPLPHIVASSIRHSSLFTFTLSRAFPRGRKQRKWPVLGAPLSLSLSLLARHPKSDIFSPSHKNNSQLIPSCTARFTDSNDRLNDGCRASQSPVTRLPSRWKVRQLLRGTAPSSPDGHPPFSRTFWHCRLTIDVMKRSTCSPLPKLFRRGN